MEIRELPSDFFFEFFFVIECLRCNKRKNGPMNTTPHTTLFCFCFFNRWQNDKSDGTSNEVPTHNKEIHYDFAGSVADGKLEARAVPEADFWQNQPGTNGKKQKSSDQCSS